jgi:hypothetical protein
MLMLSNIRSLRFVNHDLVDVSSSEIHNENENENEINSENDNEDELHGELLDEFQGDVGEIIDAFGNNTLILLNYRGRTFYYFFEEKEQNLLTQSQFDNLKKYTQFLVCPICMEDSDENIELPCEHIFCNKCIKKWLLQKQNSCPNCRNILT